MIHSSRAHEILAELDALGTEVLTIDGRQISDRPSFVAELERALPSDDPLPDSPTLDELAESVERRLEAVGDVALYWKNAEILRNVNRQEFELLDDVLVSVQRRLEAPEPAGVWRQAPIVISVDARVVVEYTKMPRFELGYLFSFLPFGVVTFTGALQWVGSSAIVAGIGIGLAALRQRRRHGETTPSGHRVLSGVGPRSAMVDVLSGVPPDSSQVHRSDPLNIALDDDALRMITTDGSIGPTKDVLAEMSDGDELRPWVRLLVVKKKVHSFAVTSRHNDRLFANSTGTIDVLPTDFVVPKRDPLGLPKHWKVGWVTRLRLRASLKLAPRRYRGELVALSGFRESSNAYVTTRSTMTFGGKTSRSTRRSGPKGILSNVRDEQRQLEVVAGSDPIVLQIPKLDPRFVYLLYVEPARKDGRPATVEISRIWAS